MGMAIYCLRHGETKWATIGRHTGLTDIPLTDNGVLQGIDAGMRLRRLHPSPFKNVYVSPSSRAIDTARNAGLHDFYVMDELHEWDYGYAEGLTAGYIQHRLHDDTWSIWNEDAQKQMENEGIGYRDDPDEYSERVGRAHRGESINDIFNRARHVLTEIDLSSDVLIVAHSHFIRFLAAAWVDDISLASHMDIKPARIEILDRGGHGDNVITGWGL